MSGIESTGPWAPQIGEQKRKWHADGDLTFSTQEEESSSRGFLTIVPGPAVLTTFILMCSGQETDKLTRLDSRSLCQA